VPRASFQLRLILSALLSCAAWTKADDSLSAKADASHVPLLKIQCVAALKGLVSDAAPKLTEDGTKLKPAAGGGSADAYSALGTGTADFVLTLRPMSGEERAAYPEKEFHEFELGKQAVALIIPEFLWERGIRSLTRDQIVGIFERRFTNWDELGGPRRSIEFLNPEPGLGVWEMFASWLYGDPSRAAAGRFQSVANSEIAAAAVQFNSGGISLAYLRWANQKDVFALPIKDDSGALIAPNLENIASGKYPLTRSIYLATAGRAFGKRRQVIDLFTGRDMREILLRNDIIPDADLAGKGGSTK
jgi:phosphate transport system substrate-binding protein